MRTRNNLFAILCLLLVTATLLCGCNFLGHNGDIFDQQEEISPTNTATTPSPEEESLTPIPSHPSEEGEFPTAKSADEAMMNIIHSDDPQCIRRYVTEGSKEFAEKLVHAYPGSDYSISLDYAGNYYEYEIYYYHLKSTLDENREEKGYALFYCGDEGYQLCIDSDVLERFIEEARCNHCNGNGSIRTGGTICGICGGTGQQYYPSAYYDTTLQMWQGLWQACSGCGGAGMVGVTVDVCPVCMGNGLII